MDEQTMFELLEVYDAVNDLREVEEMLVGESIGVGPGEEKWDKGDYDRHSMIEEVLGRR